VHKTTYAPMIYTIYSLVHNVLDACISITWGSARGLGPGILELFGPQMALAYRLDAIAQGPKTLEFQGCKNHRSINSYTIECVFDILGTGRVRSICSYSIEIYI
jgi:hypothetical protein